MLVISGKRPFPCPNSRVGEGDTVTLCHLQKCSCTVRFLDLDTMKVQFLMVDSFYQLDTELMEVSEVALQKMT